MNTPSGIFIGTSGWSYPRGEGTWNGNFYPEGKIDELSFYSQYFNTVEINTSFYSPVNPAYAYNWARKVPDSFLFTAKLWQKFTHPAMFKAATGEEAVISAADIELFNQGLYPLVRAGKLGALLAQFPPGFRNDSAGRQILIAVMSAFRDYPLAIELRHRSWSDDAGTAKLLADYNAAWACIDTPDFSTCISGDLPITANFAYFRFHGRNRETWWTGNAETRYKYLYSAEEMQQLTDRVAAAAAKTRMTFAFFNNHWKAWAPKNATDMKKAMGQGGPQLAFD